MLCEADGLKQHTLHSPCKATGISLALILPEIVTVLSVEFGSVSPAT